MAMKMKFGRRQKWLVIGLFLYSALCLKNVFATGENRSVFLHRVSSNETVQVETTPCFIKTVNVLNRLECALRCTDHLPECAAIYYNDAMRLCKLLRCRLTDKLENQNLVEIPSGWELMEDTEACKNGWALFAGHCYYFNAIGTTWNQAEAYCNDNGAILIEIYSQTEEDWVKDSFLLPETGVKLQCPWFVSCSLWIGASRSLITPNFLYNSGNPILYPKWELFQPNGYGGNENCVALFRSGKLHDCDCNVYDFYYICKMKNDVK